jgi:hypothetical protein
VQDDIIYGQPLGPRVSAARPIEDYGLFLTFTNGEQRVFDVKPLLSMDVYKRLKNKNIFNSVRVSFGSILWPHDIDYCPDTLYAESIAIDEWNPDWVKLTPTEKAELEMEQGEIALDEGV